MPTLYQCNGCKKNLQGVVKESQIRGCPDTFVEPYKVKKEGKNLYYHSECAKNLLDK